MATPKLVMRMPESDVSEAAEVSIVAANQIGPGLGGHCISDRPTPSGVTPSGELSRLGEVDVYVTKPSDYPHSPSKLLLLLTSGTGLHSKNNQLQADKYAREGFLVVMPDMFENDPAPNTTALKEEDHASIIEKIKMRAAETAKSFMIDMWLARHTSDKVLPILHRVIEAVREEFADAIASGNGIYCVGYCFGAKYCLQLARENPDGPVLNLQDTKLEKSMVPKEPYIKAGAIAHGTLITNEDIDQIRSPMLFICVEDDQLFPDTVREAGKDSLKANGIDHEVKIYPNVPHGFAVLGDYDEPSIIQAQGQAFEEMLAWLKMR